MLRNFYFTLFIGVTAILASCGHGKSGNDDTDTTKIANAVIPDFNSDSSFSYVEKQVLFGPRVPNTEAHAKCAGWLIDKLKLWCDTVIVQNCTVRAYDGKMLNGKNIIGSFSPKITVSACSR